MALTNPKIFGLNVRSILSDVKNKPAALRNIGLNPLDLAIIKGSRGAGMNRFDWVSFARLNQPLYRILDRYLQESQIFNSIISNRAGTDQTLFGNLNINGSISGNAIRYRFLEDGDPGKIADISTSRVSAWSSSDSKASDPDPTIQAKARISYGARVEIGSGGKLEFGEQSDVSDIKDKPRLQTTIIPEIREFDSERPNTRIKCKINDNTVYLYAMKGIPLTFRGFFRNLDATVTIIPTGNPPVYASWKIVETANENLYSNFPNKGGASSSIRFRSPISRERFIKFYYDPNQITSIKIRSANLRDLPSAKLNSCEGLDFAYNSLRIFPNFSFIAENLKTLSIMRNPFYLSDIESERKFNSAVLAKIPPTLNSLNFEGTFYGSIERNIISERLPNLTSLNCSRGSGAYFHPDNLRTDNTAADFRNYNRGDECFCPDVPSGVTNYSIRNNDFRSVDLQDIGGANSTQNQTDPQEVGTSRAGTQYENGSYSFKKLPNLENLDVYGNYSLNDADTGTPETLTLRSADNQKIKTIDIGNTSLKIPTNLSSCQSLTNYNAQYNRNHANQLVTNINDYKFSGCNSLTNLSFYATNLGQIRFPKFNNANLSNLDLRYTGIKGGRPDGNEDFVIHNSTFEDAVELRNIYIDSNKLISSAIESNALANLSKLYYFWYRSHGKTSGDISQLFNSNPGLTYIWMENNKFNGSVPNLQAQKGSIYYVNLANNALTGSIPEFKNLTNLRFLYLQNNSLNSIGEPDLLPNLRRYIAHTNQLVGQIPNFSTCPNLTNLVLYNNQLTSYKIGSFEKIYQIKFLELSNNRLSQTAQDDIIFDLHKNWESFKGIANVNLKGNKNESGSLVSPSDEAKEKAKILVANGWTIGVNGGLI